jgi:integrase
LAGGAREDRPPIIAPSLAGNDLAAVGSYDPGAFNPAGSVRGPRHVVTCGQTPVLDPAEARALLDSIDVSTHVGLRDRALIGLMVYSFARIGAALGMSVEDVYTQNRRTLWSRAAFLKDSSAATTFGLPALTLEKSRKLYNYKRDARYSGADGINLPDGTTPNRLMF